MNILQPNKIIFNVALALTATLTACGHYPAYLSSHRDIASTSKHESHINASKLSSNEFSALAKFTNVYEFDLDGIGGTDEKLGALERIRLYS
jgi:hypothetical protein